MNKNREIKFRVWNTRSNGFVVNDENRSISFNLWNWATQMNDCLKYPIDDFIFQQYTGLKDKNGVEIYEGDILKCKGFDGWFDKEGYYYNRDVKYVIGQTEETEISGYLHIPIGKEVIGNIMENPELLKNLE